VVLTLLIPESPYFFIYKNKNENANISMMKFRDGSDVDISDELTAIKVWNKAFYSLRLMDIGIKRI